MWAAGVPQAGTHSCIQSFSASLLSLSLVDLAEQTERSVDLSFLFHPLILAYTEAMEGHP